MTEPYRKRVATARKLGSEASNACTEKAGTVLEGFSDKAFQFLQIKANQAANDEVWAGEDLVNEMKMAGLRPHDDRAFGGVFVRAINKKVLIPVGFRNRVKGHGAPGGRTYKPGKGEQHGRD